MAAPVRVALVVPVAGFAILALVIWNANVAAQRLGFVWLGIGLVILVILYAVGRRPRLAGLGGEAPTAAPDAAKESA